MLSRRLLGELASAHAHARCPRTRSLLHHPVPNSGYVSIDQKMTDACAISSNQCDMRHTQVRSSNDGQRPGPTGMSEGVITPQKKNLMRLVRLALIAKCVTGTLLTTVCSHVNREGKKETATQAFAETNSNEFR